MVVQVRERPRAGGRWDLSAHGGLELPGARAVPHPDAGPEGHQRLHEVLAVPQRLDAHLRELVVVKVEEHLLRGRSASVR